MQLASAPAHIHETNPAPKAGTDIATALDFGQPAIDAIISSHVSGGQPVVRLLWRHARLVTLAMTFAAVGPSSVAPHGFAFGGKTLSAAQVSRPHLCSRSVRPVVLTMCVMLATNTSMGHTPTLAERVGGCVPFRRVNCVPLVLLNRENPLLLESQPSSSSVQFTTETSQRNLNLPSMLSSLCA